ncbi:CHAT domain-containing protein [Gymnopilus junonius]|uniref:CHAT domain-containing protein n=1 Tax=Gymnopilus junonius TaxID=109634 RepID=A0A9P5TK02_GYMJU|nr:CHAT domain-containing protein [Gymnopilus junonius]
MRYNQTDIVVKCSPKDKDTSKLAGLMLTIIDTPDRRLELTRTSSTAWQPNDDAEIVIPAQGFLAVAASGDLGDLGRIKIKLGDLSAQKKLGEQSGIRTGQDSKRVFELQPINDAPGLTLLFDVMPIDRRPVDVFSRDIDISELYFFLQLLPDVDDPIKAEMLQFCGDGFQKRFEITQNERDIRSAIEAYEQAVACLAEDGPRRGILLGSLASAYNDCHDTFGNSADVDKAIIKGQMAVTLMPDGHPYIPRQLNTLGSSFLCQFERTGELSDISKSIQLRQRALQLIPEGHPDLPGSLSNLGGSFLRRFERTGELSDLSESIKLGRRSVQLTPEGHPELSALLSNLGGSLYSHYEQTGQLKDISESIQFHQQAVRLISDGHSALPGCLNNLAISLFTRFKRTGELADISEAIRYQQRAVKLTPDHHPALPTFLDNLGNSYLCRFDRTGDLADISESIQFKQCAIQLTPDEHANLPGWLNNLGNSYLRRFEQTGDLADISKSVQHCHRAVQLTPVGHPELRGRLSNLGTSFFLRFEGSGDFADLSKSIEIRQRALELAPVGHPDLPGQLNNLGNSMFRRFEQTGTPKDVLESIQLHQRAIQLTPDGHAVLPKWLHNLGTSFHLLFEYSQEPEALNEALFYFRRSAIRKMGEAFQTVVTFSPSDLLDAHERVMYLLSVIAGVENTVKRRHDVLEITVNRRSDIQINSSELSTAAAVAALSVNNPKKALEWLEQGRCIVWNQINQLRTPVDDLRAHSPSLANEFSAVSKQLELAGSRKDPRHGGTLAKEREKLLASIRNIPGFEHFLQPRKCADLMRELPEDGPVVIIIAHEDRCDALILLAGHDEPMHVPLNRFSYEKAIDFAKGLRKYLSAPHLRSRYSKKTNFHLRAARPAKHPAILRELLRTLWTDLVDPILQSLAMTIKSDSGDLPRIWWCPTGPFAFLPIHAAGIYREGKGAARGECLADFAVSSFIPTLSILDRLRSRKIPSATSHGLLLVSQPDTPGLGQIPYTIEEVQKARDALDKRGIRSASYNSKHATADVILESLESFSCVHLACHASQDIESPLESAIHLYDKPLKLSDIMKKDLPNADLAFMSACQTSAGDEKLSEEAVHLAAGMLTAGYRSVVATMWSISDMHAPYVAQTFYENLLHNKARERDVKLDGIGAARALHTATRHLREKLGDSDEGLLVWIPYIHVGI